MCAHRLDSTNPSGPLSDAGDTGDGRLELGRLAAALRNATVNVAWRQWRELGAGAATRLGGHAGHKLHTLIDPEALVLISLVLMRDERRLTDILHDWAAQNSDLLSVQRMKNLEARYPDLPRCPLVRHLAWFAAVAGDEGKDLRWRSVALTWRERSNDESDRAHDRAPLFDEPSVRSAAKSGEKARATRARLFAGASLLLRLRLGFGVGVKADLLAFLLARSDEWATVRDIAEATAYTPTAVRRAAEDLSAARLIQALEGKPSSYRVMNAAWSPLLALTDGPPRWANWHERFVFVSAFLQWADSARERPLSAYALGAYGRDLLERHRPAFERDLVALWSPHSPIQDWVAFLQRGVRSLVNDMEEMA